MNGSLHHREHGRDATAGPAPSPAAGHRPATALRQLLAELRGPGAAPRPLDARALAALAANPGCRRRALLDGAGVDKSALARALGSPAGFGRSEFAFVRGNVFEARVRADGGAELIRLLRERFGADGPVPEPGEVNVPDLSAPGPEGRTARTRLALAEAFAGGGWTLLFHPMVRLDVAGSPAALEPDAVAVHPDGSCTVVEVKSFPVVDGSADAAKVGAAARQAAVYVLALRGLAEEIDRQPAAGGDATLPAQAQGQAQAGAADAVRRERSGVSAGAPGAGQTPDAGPHGAGRVRSTILLVCPKDFSNLPTAEPVDVRKQLAVTRRQLDRLTRIEDIAAALPEGTTFDLRLADDGRTPTRPAEELTAAVDAVPAAYAPECLAACELAFHCRARSREAGAVEALGRGVRGELGGLTTVESVLEAAFGEHGDPADPAVAALRRAAALRAEALATAGDAAGLGELPAADRRKGGPGCR
ncbi:hypothetical protein DMH02_008895 [Streptomyces sp. WAC 00631]|uniref:hypothetical protein n=1 Tax=unclassified Streptomyces TaxID=2593676 RepID=UPI001E486A63|nr:MULTISPECIES: hypothetical protein [unclassified Streptomyces]MCC5033330.1 hypothetical protein [Streptomyces sp. WAC 00631]MCC9741419.1 hypothetical protein [Streptomyces sp. MNU89]